MWYDDSARVLRFGVDETPFTIREDGIGIRPVTRDDGHTGWAYLPKLITTRAVMYTFDWPSGKLTNACLLYPTDPTFAAKAIPIRLCRPANVLLVTRVPAGLKTGCRSLSAEIVLAPTHVAC